MAYTTDVTNVYALCKSQRLENLMIAKHRSDHGVVWD